MRMTSLRLQRMKAEAAGLVSGVEFVPETGADVGEAGIGLTNLAVRHVLDRRHDPPVLTKLHAPGARFVEVEAAAVGLHVVRAGGSQRSVVIGAAERGLEEQDVEQ